MSDSAPVVEVISNRTGFVLRALLATIIILSAPQVGADDPPDLLAEVAADLGSRPWAATFEVTVGPVQPDSPFWNLADDPPMRNAALTVWFDPAPAVRLALGDIRVVATPGRLVAVHWRNPDIYFSAEHADVGIAEMLAASLPPLWCPWLAIAIEGDASAFPRVGSPDTWRIDWDDQPWQAPTMAQPLPVSFRGRGGPTGIETVCVIDVSEPAPTPVVPEPRVLASYSIRFDNGSGPLGMYFRRSDRDPALWTPIEIDGRTRVGSLTSLIPKPPDLTSGDRFPVIAMSAIDEDDLANRTWRPSEIFDPERRGRRPDAGVLVLLRAGPDAAHRLARLAVLHNEAIRAADPDAPLGVLSRAVICTETDDVRIDRLEPLREIWSAAATSDPLIPEAEARAPALAWCPAPLLLDRVAPGAPAAIVVIDRSGWIVGVHEPDADAGEIAESIRAAGR